jgi:CHAT domain-containing protein
VVLSSCESGVGKFMQGEGIMSLSRGFFYAGCHNIVFSLWKVYDKVTPDLMCSFYKNVLEGKSYASSLREAKLEFIKNPVLSLPKTWSSFILLGE